MAAMFEQTAQSQNVKKGHMRQMQSALAGNNAKRDDVRTDPDLMSSNRSDVIHQAQGVIRKNSD